VRPEAARGELPRPSGGDLAQTPPSDARALVHCTIEIGYTVC
jgi:hypothetical protein